MLSLTSPLTEALPASVAEQLADGLDVHDVNDLLRYYPKRYIFREGRTNLATTDGSTWVAGEQATVRATIVSASMVSMRSRRGKLLKILVDADGRMLEVTFFHPHAIARALVPGVDVILDGVLKASKGRSSGRGSGYSARYEMTHPDFIVVPSTTGAVVRGSSVAASAVTSSRGARSSTTGSRVAGSSTTSSRVAGSSTGSRGSVSSTGSSTAQPLIGGGKFLDIINAVREFASEGDRTLDPLSIIAERPVIPVYRGTKAVSSWTVFIAIDCVLRSLEPLSDPLPEKVRTHESLIDLDQALRRIHLGTSQESISAARRRLRFDEALSLQLFMENRRRNEAIRAATLCAHVSGGLEDGLVERLTFTLTEGQKSVLSDIGEDLTTGHAMNRLLQGEVGSGKTILALLSMLRVIDNGHQCALLAPTEVLATQHARTIRELLGALGTGGKLGAPDVSTRVTLLTGSMGTADRRQSLLDIVSGEAGLVIGTHALIQDTVEFFDLGLVVIDEQHRFGVEQRERLRDKGRGDTTPHVLVMTATPIPRTIAMTVFGDLTVSTLRELPRGERKVSTHVVATRTHPTWLERTWERVVEEVKSGHQAFVVCPRIGDDEDSIGGIGSDGGGGGRPAAVEEVFEELSEGPLHQLRIGMLHGRQTSEDKDRTMLGFSQGDLDILVCTTVIEVGVDVPAASMMIILDAERFGVSQLHQLRGRVGRGGDEGLCLLVTGVDGESTSADRLRALAGSNDGFVLARLDLEQRGEGNVLGDAQSGVESSLKLLSLIHHEDVIIEARKVAVELLDDDPTLEAHLALREILEETEKRQNLAYLEKA